MLVALRTLAVARITLSARPVSKADTGSRMVWPNPFRCMLAVAKLALDFCHQLPKHTRGISSTSTPKAGPMVPRISP